MALVGVIALKLGSALALVLVCAAYPRLGAGGADVGELLSQGHRREGGNRSIHEARRRGGDGAGTLGEGGRSGCECAGQLPGAVRLGRLLSEWMVLIGVVALELGSALAVVLVRAAAPATARTAPQNAGVDSDTAASVASATDPTTGSAASKPQPARTPVNTPPRTAPRPGRARRLGRPSTLSKEAAGKEIVETLHAQGGRIEGGSVRGLARLIGGKLSTVHSAIAALVAAGVVARVGGGLVLQG